MKGYILFKKDAEKYKAFKELGKTDGDIRDIDISERLLKTNSVIKLSDNENDMLLLSSDKYALLKAVSVADDADNYIIKGMSIDISTTAVPAQNHQWSDNELNALKILYPIYGLDLTSILISRSIESITKKARSLNLKKLSPESVDYNDAIKASRKYVKVEINDGDEYYVLDIISCIMKLSSEAPDIDMPDNIAESNAAYILRHVVRYFSVEDIIKYSETSTFSLKAILIYGFVYGREALYVYMNAHHNDVVKAVYSVMGYDWDNESFVNYNYLNYFAVIIIRSESLSDAIYNINFMLNGVGKTIDTLIDADNILHCEDSIYHIIKKLAICLTNDELVKYINSSIHGSLIGNDISDAINELLVRKEYNKIDDELFKKSEYVILESYLIEGHVEEFRKLLTRIHPDKKFVINSDILKILTHNQKYYELISDYELIFDEIEISDILYTCIMSAMCNNTPIAKLLFVHLNTLTTDENDISSSIFDVEEVMLNHFKLHENDEMVKLLS